MSGDLRTTGLLEFSLHSAHHSSRNSPDLPIKGQQEMGPPSSHVGSRCASKSTLVSEEEPLGQSPGDNGRREGTYSTVSMCGGHGEWRAHIQFLASTPRDLECER